MSLDWTDTIYIDKAYSLIPIDCQLVNMAIIIVSLVLLWLISSSKITQQTLNGTGGLDKQLNDLLTNDKITFEP